MSYKDYERKVIRVRQVAPGVWVPDDKGDHEFPAAWAGMADDAHRTVIRAAVHERERAYTEHLAGPLTRDELRYLGITDPDGFQPEPVAYPALTLADLDDAIAAFRAAKNRPPVVLPSGARFTPRGPVLRSCGVTGPALSSGYGPEAVPPEKTLATGAGERCRHCGGQLQGQVLAEADERGCYAYCAASPDQQHEAGPAAETGQMDPADAIRAALYEPLMLDEAALDELAPYGKAGPGLCCECRVGRTLKGTGGLCYYCNLSKRLAAGQAPELAMSRAAVGQARQALKTPQDPVLAVELARRRSSCYHGSVRDGQCRRCGAAVTPGDTAVQSLTRFSRKAQVIFTLMGSVFLWLGTHYSPIWYVLATLYLTMGLVLPRLARRQQ